jgi:transposase-like protein
MHRLQWRTLQADIIFLCVQWYLRYPPNHRHFEEMRRELGLTVNFTKLDCDRSSLRT